MATSNFNLIDANQIATARQVYGVACHFASIHAESPSERYGLTKVFNAVLNKHYKNHDSFMTHSDVSEFREWDCVPEVFLSYIKKPTKLSKKAVAFKKSIKTGNKPKASVQTKQQAKSKAFKKATDRLNPPKPKASKKIATPKPKASKKPTLTNRVDAMEAKLDKIFEILSAK
mgnify:CR=1 FL=1